MPSQVPVSWTPSVNNGQVQAIAQVGTSMVIGGTFTAVNGVARSRLAAFNVTNGTLSSFAPVLDGAVTSLTPGPTASTVFVAGAFKTVNGAARRGVALLDLGTGTLVSTFDPKVVNGPVNDVVLRGNQLYLGGTFTKVANVARGGLARVNATTGALDAGLNIALTEHHNNSGGGAQASVGAVAIDVTADNATMVVVGNFRKAAGLMRQQVALIDLTGAAAFVKDSWATTKYEPLCFNGAFDTYMRGVSFAPDGSYFAVTSTGGPNGGTLCDSATRWETGATGADVSPTWVTPTGGDTLWGITVTNNAVYVGGHQRWLNNPLGGDNARAGAVARPGLAALDPVSGRPLAWNPGRNPRGVAAYSILGTSAGVWVGSNTDWVGNRRYKRMKIAFFPYAGGTSQTSTAIQGLPATAYLGKADPGTTNVLYRVNAAGGTIASTDDGPDWADDSQSDSPYRNTGSNTASASPVPAVDGTVPVSTPSAIFDTERWDPGSPGDGSEMSWAFPVPSNVPLRVRLYFANRYDGTSQAGQRVFDVALEGATVLDNFDIVAAAGDQTGTMRSFNIVSDGVVNLDLSHVVENPLINGIEIIRTDVTPTPGGDGTLSKASFDGTTAGTPAVVGSAGIVWKNVRGAFTAGSKLFYGATDAKLHVASFTGGVIGASSIVQPYHDPAWMNVDTGSGQTYDGVEPTLYSQFGSVSGMAYAKGKLYFTRIGDSRLYWKWFSPDSGIMDELTGEVPSSVSFADADGLMIDGSSLYVGSRSTGALRKVAFTGGEVTGSADVVNGPSTGGIDWRNTALFLGPAA